MPAAQRYRGRDRRCQKYAAMTADWEGCREGRGGTRWGYRDTEAEAPSFQRPRDEAWPRARDNPARQSLAGRRWTPGGMSRLENTNAPGSERPRLRYSPGAAGRKRARRRRQ